MKTVNEIRPTKEAAEHDLLKRPGVTAVDIGYKYVGGKKTDELSIRVYVEKKKEKLPKEEAIPPVIEGIKTDVIERKYVLHPLKVPLQQIELHADTGRYDPLRGGISIGPCRAVNGSIFAGTLGVVVTDNATSAPMLLSNFHVMCVDNQWQAGDTMAQPSRLDGGNCPADVVGALQRAVLNDKVDCAVSNSYMRTNTCEIIDVGAVSGVAAAAVNMHVKKRGRTTALTYGTIDTVDLSVEIDYGDGLGKVRLTHQVGIMVDTSQSSKIGDHGDSGSALVNDSNQVVGLYFAGSEDGSSGIANPIQDVLSALDVSICTSLQPPFAQAGVKAKELGKEKDKEWEKIQQKDMADIKDWEKSKDAHKEHKQEIKEFKDQAHKQESKDFKEAKDHKIEQKEHKIEWKEHKDESKEQKERKDELKSEWKDQKEHKHETKDQLKAEPKEAAIEKNPQHETLHPPALGQIGATAAAGGVIKPQLKPEFKEKETLKAEWKEHKNETKDHKNESKDSKDHKHEAKDHKNETKDHKHETKETPKIEWKEAAIEKVQRIEGPEPLGQAGAMAAGGGIIKPQLKPEFKEKETLKAEWKEQLKNEWKEHKNESKEHKDESKEHKNEWKEHHKEQKFEIKEHKPEWKETALEKLPRLEGPEPLGQTGAMAAAGGAFKSQQKDLVDKESFKAEFKDHKTEVKDQKEGKESFKAEFKDELKVEWKEHKNESKEHKDESKEDKNEWKEHHKEQKFEIKEHKLEQKEVALEKNPQIETMPGFQPPFMSHFIPSNLRPDLSMGALGREPTGQQTLSEKLKRQADEAKQAKDNKDAKEMKEMDKLSEG